jgi:hypothetical protein
LPFVFDHMHKGREWHLPEALVDSLTESEVLFPLGAVSNNNCSYVILYAISNYSIRDFM